jgi:hypothetical protein
MEEVSCESSERAGVYGGVGFGPCDHSLHEEASDRADDVFPKRLTEALV